jgi:bifunctional non-homologous end joining protein LigD
MSRKPTSALPPFELTAPVSAKALPQGPQWVHEIEHDGRRCAAMIENGTVRLLTRNHRDVTRQFHAIAADLLAIRGHDAIIDGEIVGLDASGAPRIEALHRAIEASAYESLVYIAFDLLFLDSVDLRRWPLLSRKDALRDLLKPLEGTRIRYVKHLEGDRDRDRVYAQLSALGAERVISKAATAPYRGGRDPSWLKVKLRAANAGRAHATEKWNLLKTPRR